MLKKKEARRKQWQVKSDMVRSEDATLRVLKALEETAIKYAKVSSKAPSRLWKEIQTLRQ